MGNTEVLYERFLKLTGDPLAASNLVLAHCLEESKPVPPDAVLTVTEAASMLRVAEATIYDMCNSGRLAHTRYGAGRGTIRIKRADLENYSGPRFRGKMTPHEQSIADRLERHRTPGRKRPRADN